MIAAIALLLVVILICVTTFACIQVTHRHNRQLSEMNHRQHLEKENHKQLLRESEKKTLDRDDRRW
jgi:hypothetical protein